MDHPELSLPDTAPKLYLKPGGGGEAIIVLKLNTGLGFYFLAGLTAERAFADSFCPGNQFQPVM